MSKLEQALRNIKDAAASLQAATTTMRETQLNDDYRALCKIQADLYRLDYSLEQRKSRKEAAHAR